MPNDKNINDKDLEGRFRAEMLKIYEEAKDGCRYNAIRFLRLVNEKGGLHTAKYLLHEPKISDGFTALWECGRLDLTVEAVILKEPWKRFFTTEELDIARKRLREFGYLVSQLKE